MSTSREYTIANLALIINTIRVSPTILYYFSTYITIIAFGAFCVDEETREAAEPQLREGPPEALRGSKGKCERERTVRCAISYLETSQAIWAVESVKQVIDRLHLIDRRSLTHIAQPTCSLRLCC